MKKKSLYIIIGIIVLLGLLCFLFSSYIINWLFSSQYNENGVSHFLVITIDKTQPKEFVGELDGYNIYVENLDLKETNFRNIDAENVPIKKAISEKLVSIKDWEKYASRVKTNGNKKVLKYENYEISCENNECIIRPLFN